jgi:hypothetical protein
MKRFTVGALLLCGAVTACGDPDTDDRRGYTKAPLERPFVLIDGQERTAMDELGEPNRVEPAEVELAPEPAADPATDPATDTAGG